MTENNIYDASVDQDAKDAYFTASQGQLIWTRFKKQKAAMFGAWVHARTQEGWARVGQTLGRVDSSRWGRVVDCFVPPVFSATSLISLASVHLSFLAISLIGRSLNSALRSIQSNCC